jgi:hypothetical protein
VDDTRDEDTVAVESTLAGVQSDEYSDGSCRLRDADGVVDHGDCLRCAACYRTWTQDATA